jgi:hypothetical protein
MSATESRSQSPCGAPVRRRQGAEVLRAQREPRLLKAPQGSGSQDAKWPESLVACEHGAILPWLQRRSASHEHRDAPPSAAMRMTRSHRREAWWITPPGTHRFEDFQNLPRSLSDQTALFHPEARSASLQHWRLHSWSSTSALPVRAVLKSAASLHDTRMLEIDLVVPEGRVLPSSDSSAEGSKMAMGGAAHHCGGLPRP